MFTGIIEAVGTFTECRHLGGDMRLAVDAGGLDLADVECGDSIAVNGICLTVVSLGATSFAADVSAETLSHTTAGDFKIGDSANLEKALTLSSRLGGHLVSGHVDGVGRVVERKAVGNSVRFRIESPEELSHYIARKGSVCVDGTSLTVNGVKGNEFDLNIVPHTLDNTIMTGYRPGTRVNLEVDIIARYVERMLKHGEAVDGNLLTVEKLKEKGFL